MIHHLQTDYCVQSYWKPLAHVTTVQPAVAVQGFRCPFLVSQVASEHTGAADTNLTSKAMIGISMLHPLRSVIYDV